MISVLYFAFNVSAKSFKPYTRPFRVDVGLIAFGLPVDSLHSVQCIGSVEVFMYLYKHLLPCKYTLKIGLKTDAMMEAIRQAAEQVDMENFFKMTTTGK